MNAFDLKNPGIDQLSQTTRMNVAKLISNVRNETNPSGDVAAFLLDAASKAPGYVKPAPDPLPATSAVVTNGQALPLWGTAALGISGTLGVANSVAARYTLPATATALKNGDVVTIGATNYTFTIAGNKITAITVA